MWGRSARLRDIRTCLAEGLFIVNYTVTDSCWLAGVPSPRFPAAPFLIGSKLRPALVIGPENATDGTLLLGA